MNKLRIVLAIALLAAASLACNTISGGGQSAPAPQPPGAATPSNGNPGVSNSSNYPTPDDAQNLISIGGVTTFQTKVSLNDAMNFYRDSLGKEGYTEQTDHTVTAAGTFSMVFDGDPGGKALVVQGVELGDGTINITLFLQDA